MAVTEAFITLTSAMFGTDFTTGNEILGTLGLSEMTVERILHLAEHGYA